MSSIRLRYILCLENDIEFGLNNLIRPVIVLFDIQISITFLRIFYMKVPNLGMCVQCYLGTLSPYNFFSNVFTQFLGNETLSQRSFVQHAKSSFRENKFSVLKNILSRLVLDHLTTPKEKVRTRTP